MTPDADHSTSPNPLDAALRESESRFRIVAATAPVAIFQTDPQGACTYVNDRWCEDAGLTREQALGSGWVNAVHPDDRARVSALWNASTASQDSCNAEYRFLRPDGVVIWLRGTASPVFGDDGERLGYVGTSIDITEQLDREKRLRQSEAKFRGLIESSPLPYALNDHDLNITYLNPAFVQTFGYNLDDIRTVADWWPLAYPDERYRAWVAQQWAQRLEQSRVDDSDFAPLEVQIRCKDGSDRVAVVHAHSIGEALTGIHAVVFHDITERAAAKEALSLAAAIADNMNEGANIIRARDGVIVYVTGQFARMFGYDPSELIGHHASILNAAADRSPQEVANAIISSLSAHGAWSGELLNVRKDGTAFWSRASVTPFTHPTHGDVWISVHRDITDQKQIEAARLNSQRLESLGTLAGGIAHDFNNLLAAISGNAELAANEVAPDSSLAQSLAEIQRASGRATELVRRITAFGRPKERNLTPVSLPSVVEEVLELLRPAVPARIAMRTRFGPDIRPVLADAAQVHEAIVNLALNSAYAIGSVAGTIEYGLAECEVSDTMAARLSLTAGRYVQLSVTDTGVGMDEVTRARAFDAFFTTKPPGQGSGLGLSMVYGIMQGHGGAVDIESVPGQGTTVRLYFPAAALERTARVEANAAAAHPAHGAGRHVLHVDDEAALVTLIKRALTSLGYTVTGVTDPRRALEAFRSDPTQFDIIVTDLSMPHMSGFEFAQEVLALRPDIPVVMTTGYADLEDEARAREVGIREIIKKPPSLAHLSAVLNRISGRD